MKTRTLGRSGLSLPPIMFGGNVFGWTADESMSFRLLDRLREAGLNAIDTADVYSKWAPGNQGGESEAIIGKWLSQSGGRDKLVLATKCGMELAPDRKGLSAKWIAQAVEDSLRRLQTDCIDLYQAHQDDKDTPLEETLIAFAKLIEQGKVRAIGASNYTAARLKEALETSARLGLPRYESLQPHYNLMARAGYEAELEPLIRTEDIGVISYFSLARGYLTGKYRTEADLGKSPRGRQVSDYLHGKGPQVLAALGGIAAEHRATPGAVALAWLIARPGITAPIASATSLDQLDELAAAASLELKDDEIAALDEASR